MAKVSGGTRMLKSGSREWNKRQAEVEAMQNNPKYSSVKFYGEGGGYVAIEKSNIKHKVEELEAAEHLAKRGYKVILTDEAGNIRTPDGKLFSASFEQRTPQGSSVLKCLEHAKKKKADIAVIFDKHENYHKQDISEGITRYELYNGYRFKQIIVIERNGMVHRHTHNK